MLCMFYYIVTYQHMFLFIFYFIVATMLISSSSAIWTFCFSLMIVVVKRLETISRQNSIGPIASMQLKWHFLFTVTLDFVPNCTEYLTWIMFSRFPRTFSPFMDIPSFPASHFPPPILFNILPFEHNSINTEENDKSKYLFAFSANSRS